MLSPKPKFPSLDIAAGQNSQSCKGAWSKFPGLSRAFERPGQNSPGFPGLSKGLTKIPRCSKVQTKIPRAQPRDRVLGIFVGNKGNKRPRLPQFPAWRRSNRPRQLGRLCWHSVLRASCMVYCQTVRPSSFCFSSRNTRKISGQRLARRGECC